MHWLEELKRRNVIRVGIAYLAFAWLLVQFADIVLPAFGAGSNAVRLLLLTLAIGLIPALVLAWVYEITPQGVRRDAVAGPKPVAETRHLDRAIMVGLALAVTVFALDKFVLEDRSGRQATAENLIAAEDKRIAVLPFVALSSGEDDGYFADGLTEEVINTLASLPRLLVTARTSSFYFKDTNLPIPQIALTLGVGHLVEGSVRREGDRVRITAQLVRASDGFQHWSKTYDRTLDNVFLVQQDIAENIAKVLDVALDATHRERMRRSSIRDVEAFIDYQKGLELFVDAHVELADISMRLREANVYFDRALERAPDLVQARVLKADQSGHALFEITAGYREPIYPQEAADARAALHEQFVQAARLTPRTAERAVIEAERALFSEDWTGLAGKMDAAMTPADCGKINWIAEIAGPFGWADAMVEFLRSARECDPLNAITVFMLPAALVWSGDSAAALLAAAEADQIGIDHLWLEEGRIAALRSLDRLDQARARVASLPVGVRARIQLQIDAQAGAPDVRTRLATYSSSEKRNDHDIVLLAAAIGDRALANRIAAEIDARPGSAFVLVAIVFNCYCGAPFDLEATPNLAARIAEADLSWPPPSPIRFPGKDW